MLVKAVHPSSHYEVFFGGVGRGRIYSTFCYKKKHCFTESNKVRAKTEMNSWSGGNTNWIYL